MSIANLFVTCLSTISEILAMTPRERWGSATRGLDSSDASISTCLIVSVSAVLIILIASSIIVTYKQKPHKK